MPTKPKPTAAVPIPGSRAHKRDSRLAHRFGDAPPIARPAPARKDFNAKNLLKQTGFRVRDEQRAYGSDVGKLGATIDSLGAGDLFGDLGNLALIVVGGLLGLIFLDLLLSNRGSSIAADATKWLGGGIGRLVSPTDPLTTVAVPAASSSSNTSTTPASSSSASGAAAVAAGATNANAQAAKNALFVPPTA